MRILVIAPQPFYEERGTPIAVRLLLKVLCESGHYVDLLTYHLGEDVSIDGLRIYRISLPPFVDSVPIGFSSKKLLCDIFLASKFVGLIKKNRYDVIHAGEEAVFIAMALSPFSRAKLVYDMDSSMADQLREKWRMLDLLKPALDFFERSAIRHADLVLPVCDALAEKVRHYAPDKPFTVLEDVVLESEETDDTALEDIRKTKNIKGLLALYVGNLEHYQGIGLMLEAMTATGTKNLSLVIIGGGAADIDKYKSMGRALGISEQTHFLGPRPVSQLSHYVAQADILLSPRLKGSNTPMKIYSYLASGKPVLATNIRSHTQVLDESCAYLVEPTPQSFGAGLTYLAENATIRERLGTAGSKLAQERYSYEVYRKKLTEAYVRLESSS